MPLIECRLCGRVFTHGGRKNVCPMCLRRLGDLYAEVHEYMRDHEEEDFDINKLSEWMDISPVDIQALIDLGYLTRDLRDEDEDRRRLAQALSGELAKMDKEHHKLTTYGGAIYSRGYDRKGR